MEGRNTLVALLVAVAVFMLWVNVIGPRIFPTPPGKPTTTQPDQQEQPQPPVQTTQPAATQPGIVSTQPAVTSAAIAVQSPTTQPTEQALTLGSAEKGGPFEMQVSLTQRGAGVRQVLLADYFKTPQDKEHYQLIGPAIASTAANMATESVTVAGQTVGLADVDWQLAERDTNDADDADWVRFVARLSRDGQPMLDVYKTFTLQRNSYELQVDYRLANRTDGPLEDVAVAGAGVTTLAQEGVKEDRSLVWYTKEGGASRAGRMQAISEPDKIKIPATGGEKGLLWAATDNRFFVVVLRPSATPAPIQFSAKPLGTDNEKSPARLLWSTEKFSVPAGGEPVTLSFADFLGPKDGDLFQSKAVYREMRYDQLIDYGSSCACGWLCATSFLAPFVVRLLKAVHWVIPNYGIAIILLVAVVRVLLHPLTKKSQVSMSKMSKLQPKIEEIKKKYAKDPSEMNKAMAEFYRQEGFSPILGCLPMLLQMPIWVALWAGLNTSIDLRHAPFFSWINDLAAPDALVQWTSPANAKVLPIPLIGGLIGPVYAFNLLPILLMVAMFFQQLLTPKPAGPQAGQQKFMMYFMTIFFGFLFYNMPSGLTLYVMASTAVGAGEQYVIKKHIQEQEEAEKRGELPRKKEPRSPSPQRRKRR